MYSSYVPIPYLSPHCFHTGSYPATASQSLPVWDTMKLCISKYKDVDMIGNMRKRTTAASCVARSSVLFDVCNRMWHCRD